MLNNTFLNTPSQLLLNIVQMEENSWELNIKITWNINKWNTDYLTFLFTSATTKPQTSFNIYKKINLCLLVFMANLGLKSI